MQWIFTVLAADVAPQTVPPHELVIHNAPMTVAPTHGVPCAHGAHSASVKAWAPPANHWYYLCRFRRFPTACSVDRIDPEDLMPDTITVADFLRNLASDNQMLRDFLKKPEDVLNRYNLTNAEKAIIRSGDAKLICDTVFGYLPLPTTNGRGEAHEHNIWNSGVGPTDEEFSSPTFANKA